MKEYKEIVEKYGGRCYGTVVKISPSKIHAVSSGFAILDGTLRSKIFIQFMKERAQATSDEKSVSQELFVLIKNQLNILSK